MRDQTDLLWGQKRIDKMADKIERALTDPEEAAFDVPAATER